MSLGRALSCLGRGLDPLQIAGTSRLALWVRCLLGVPLPLLALLAQPSLSSGTHQLVWFLSYPAVFFSGWLAGFAGGIVATFLSVALVYAFRIHAGGLALQPEDLFAQLVIFLVVGILVSLIHQRVRDQARSLSAARVGAERAAGDLRQSQARLAQAFEDVSRSEERYRRLFGQVEDARARLDAAVQVAQLGVWTWNLQDGALSWDDRVCELYEVPADVRARGISYDFWRSRVHPEDLPRVEMEGHRLRTQGGVAQQTFRVVRADGTARRIQSIARAEKDATGRVRSIVGVNRDVTEQQEFEQHLREANHKATTANAILLRNRDLLEEAVRSRTEQLARALDEAKSADRAKDAFLTAASHELRTPLNAIVGFSSLLADGSFGELDDEPRRAVGLVRDAGEQLAALVSDILDMANIQAGNLRVKRERVALRSLLQDQFDAHADRARERGLQLRIVECPDDLFVQADRDRLAQVVRNLLSNAVAFTDAGYVQGRAVVEDGFARIEVTDTGVGIPADQQLKLFQPFERVLGHADPNRGRTGLGLAIARRIVEAMDGRIGLVSEPGHGSTFWFTVPRDA